MPDRQASSARRERRYQSPGGFSSFSPLVRKVEHALASTGQNFAGQPIIVAVSGGADSTFLAYAVTALCQRFRYRPEIAHIDHGWRGEASHVDHEVVAGLAVSLGLPFHAKRLVEAPETRAPGGSEAVARVARYHFLRDVAEARRASAVIVGHTADDQVETILLGLLRGNGIGGITGMVPVASLPVAPRLAGVPLLLLRPLLALQRDDIRRTLRRAAVTWREDESNEDMRHPRNRLRHQVLPELEALSPGFARSLARSADHVREATLVVNAVVDAAQAQWCEVDDGWSITRTAWLALAPFVALGTLRTMLTRLNAPVAEAAHLASVARMIHAGRGGATVDLPGSVTVGLRAGSVIVWRLTNARGTPPDVVHSTGDGGR